MRASGAALCAVVVLAASGTGRAVMLELSSPDDLEHIAVGQTVTIEVSLVGFDNLPSDEGLVSLTGSVLFPADLFGTPIFVEAGEIVPIPPAGEINFHTAAEPGLADGFFVAAVSDPAQRIAAGGVFYCLAATAIAEGLGQFELDPDVLVAEQHDPGNPDLPTLLEITAAAPLSFAIPEPGTGFLFLLVGFLIVRPTQRTM